MRGSPPVARRRTTVGRGHPAPPSGPDPSLGTLHECALPLPSHTRLLSLLSLSLLALSSPGSGLRVMSVQRGLQPRLDPEQASSLPSSPGSILQESRGSEASSLASIRSRLPASPQASSLPSVCWAVQAPTRVVFVVLWSPASLGIQSRRCLQPNSAQTGLQLYINTCLLWLCALCGCALALRSFDCTARRTHRLDAFTCTSSTRVLGGVFDCVGYGLSGSSSRVVWASAHGPLPIVATYRFSYT